MFIYFKKLFKWFNKDITGKSWYSKAHHPFFGEIGYYGFNDNRVGYWECEIDVNGSAVSVIINSTTAELPTSLHQNFVESIIKDLDTTIATVKPLVLSKLAELIKYDRDKDWNQMFRLSAIEVPIDADRINDWEISFECLVDKDGHHLTCCFRKGKPEFVSVDG